VQVSAVIFGFLNIARALVPVRIALTLATAPAVDKYIIKVTVCVECLIGKQKKPILFKVRS
jgi:hypothetical protein